MARHESFKEESNMSTPDIYFLSKSAFTGRLSTFDESETAHLIDEFIPMTAGSLGGNPNTMFRNRTAAINRYIELDVLMNSRGNEAATKEMHRLSASSRDVETRLGMLPKHQA
jgi:hypothetical protein